ncbi:hypothetical protein JYU14_04305 [Simkania negevensis]|uniref:Uncharacterized protein n=1 Tax=Simkania negevensis TaxID=83561 RepID=A0ABS3ARB4_9BACT|nr:hypothetical protein [Simkania negevensis]
MITAIAQKCLSFLKEALTFLRSLLPFLKGKESAQTPPSQTPTQARASQDEQVSQGRHGAHFQLPPKQLEPSAESPHPSRAVSPLTSDNLPPKTARTATVAADVLPTQEQKKPPPAQPPTATTETAALPTQKQLNQSTGRQFFQSRQLFRANPEDLFSTTAETAAVAVDPLQTQEAQAMEEKAKKAIEEGSSKDCILSFDALMKVSEADRKTFKLNDLAKRLAEKIFELDSPPQMGTERFCHDLAGVAKGLVNMGEMTLAKKIAAKIHQLESPLEGLTNSTQEADTAYEHIGLAYLKEGKEEDALNIARKMSTAGYIRGFFLNRIGEHLVEKNLPNTPDEYLSTKKSDWLREKKFGELTEKLIRAVNRAEREQILKSAGESNNIDSLTTYHKQLTALGDSEGAALVTAKIDQIAGNM